MNENISRLNSEREKIVITKNVPVQFKRLNTDKFFIYIRLKLTNFNVKKTEHTADKYFI